MVLLAVPAGSGKVWCSYSCVALARIKAASLAPYDKL